MNGSQIRKAIVLLPLLLFFSGMLSVYVLQLGDRSQGPSVQSPSTVASTVQVIDAMAIAAPMGAGTSVVLATGLVQSQNVQFAIVLALGTVIAEAKEQERTSRLRERILDEVSSNPGIHLRELHRNLGCAMGALQYHVRQLEQESLVTSVKSGNTRHFFPSEYSRDEQVLRLTALIRNPVISSIIMKCLASDRTTQADLSRLLSMDKSLVSYYVSHLVRADVLNTVRVFGREKPLVVSDWVRCVLSASGSMVQ
jgi:predicted transcriptional regulator